MPNRFLFRLFSCFLDPFEADISVTSYFSEAARHRAAVVRNVSSGAGRTYDVVNFNFHNTTQSSIKPATRLQSRGLESLTAGLQSLGLASRLKPWLRTIDGLGWLMAASHGLLVQTRKLTAAN